MTYEVFVWMLGNTLPVYVTSKVISQSGHLLPHPLVSQFGCPDVQLICRLCTLFGLDHSQMAFALDPSNRPVCGEHLFLDLSRVLQFIFAPTYRLHPRHLSSRPRHVNECTLYTSM